MKVKCDYCGSYINDYDERCPSCGATNAHMVRNANEAPKTIEQLKQWYINMNLPDENITRFFIGKNYLQPKAFGIYKDESTGNFIVYKNKEDGIRAVRYEGKDEVYAVNELYMKLKEEIINQKRNNNSRNMNSRPVNNNIPYRNLKNKPFFIVLLIVLFIVIMAVALSIRTTRRGYYNYGNGYYYYQGGSWYSYDNSGWRPSTPPDALLDNTDNYYSSDSYSSNYGVSDFSNSKYYNADTWSSSSWDSDSSWSSSDIWDSSSTDWGSDW